jgi:hypothetical protein
MDTGCGTFVGECFNVRDAYRPSAVPALNGRDDAMVAVVPSNQDIMLPGLAGVAIDQPAARRFNLCICPGEHALKHGNEAFELFAASVL